MPAGWAARLIIAVLVRFSAGLARFGRLCAESGRRWASAGPRPEAGDSDLELVTDMDEFVTVATYDKIIDAHIALGRLAAEGIEAVLFDDNMVQMDWLYSIALGGIKLRVARTDESRARRVLATDYSHDLDDVDVGKPER